MALENRGPQIKAVGILFVTLVWISVILRCSVRVFITRLLRVDDWLAILTLGVFTAYCTVVIAGEKHGTGKHVADVPPQDYQTSMKLWYCGEITYVITTCLLKVYIGAFLLRICVCKSHIRIIWAVITIFSIFSIYYLFLIIFQCHPTSYFWRQHSEGAKGACISQTVIVDSTYAHGVMSAVADWTLGMLPIFLVWNLQMKTRTKVSVALILALGAIGSLATVIRIFYIHQLGRTKDFLYDNTDVSIWSTVEPGMGITASSIACLRPLFRTFFSHSRCLASNPALGSPWNRQPLNHVCRNNNHELEEIHLHENPTKSIYVTNAKSAQNLGDVEAAIDLRQEISKIANTPMGMNDWSKSSTADISVENGRSPPPRD